LIGMGNGLLFLGSTIHVEALAKIGLTAFTASRRCQSAWPEGTC
jgi:hypothetical protein